LDLAVLPICPEIANPMVNTGETRHQSITLTNQCVTGNVKTSTQKETQMPKTGTLTKARIVGAIVESNGYTNQKAFETVEILRIPLDSGRRFRRKPATHSD